MSSDSFNGRGEIHLPDASARSLGTDVRSPGQNHIANEEKRAKERTRTAVKLALQRAYQHVARGQFEVAGYILVERLLPGLDVDGFEVEVAHDALADTRLPWYPIELEAFVEEPDRYLRAAPNSRTEDVVDDHTVASIRADKGITPAETAKQTIYRSLQSCESLAIGRGILDARLQQSSVVLGHTQPLAIQYQQWDMDFPDPVYSVNPDKPVPFCLAIGQRGSGKSTFTASEAMDRWVAGHKILDIHDSKKLENAIYDLDQQQPTLRRIREDMGLPPTLSEADFPRPEVEIYVPLHSEIHEKQVLYDADGECRVKPFVVDPASVPPRVFDAWIGDTTKKQRQELSRARRNMPTRGWTLHDLAEEIRDGNAEERVKDDLISMLKGMQRSGWIRDAESEYLLDWDAIFRDTDTITCFSTSLMNSNRDKMRVLLYLLATLFEERDKQSVQYPRAAAVIRELHHLAPVQTNRKEDKVLKRLQKIAAAEMRENASEGRHINLEILADTQHWGQIAKRIRQHITRVAMFVLQYDSASAVFDELTGTAKHSWIKTVTDHETGECTLLADNGRIHGDDGSDWPFIHPCQAAPPPCHQIDTDNEPSGWVVRTWYTDETLGAPPDDWRITVPSRLTFGSAFHEVNGESDEHPGVAAFVRECVATDEGARIGKDHIVATYNNFAVENDYPELSKRKFSSALSDTLGDAYQRGNSLRLSKAQVPSTPYAYGDIRLNDTGEEYAAPLDEVYPDAFDDDAAQDAGGGVLR